VSWKISKVLFFVQGSDWLAKLAGDWEAAGDECGEGVRRVILRFFLTAIFFGCALLSIRILMDLQLSAGSLSRWA
jgi:hypothetical protein